MKRYRQPVLSLLTIALSSSLYAAQPVPLENQSFTTLQSEFPLSTSGLQEENKSVSTLNVIKQRTDKNKVNHVRVQQKHHNLPVHGGYGIIHKAEEQASFGSASSDKTTMNGVIYKGLENELGAPPSFLEKNKQAALQAFKKPYQSFALEEETVQPMVYIDNNHKAHWAYRVSILVAYEDKIPARPTAIIDAETLKPFIKWNDIKTLSDVRGLGFGGNESTRKYEFGENRPLLHIMRDDESETCYMENSLVKVVDMKHGYSGHDPMKFDCAVPAATKQNAYWTGYAADGLDIDNGAYSPTNDALYAGQIIGNMYKKWYGLDALTKAGKPMQMVMRVHYGRGYENAYWDGKKMTFGDGAALFHPLVSLGIGAHEISHGFTQQHSNLEYHGQSGGMNESFSDMAAQAAESYSLRKSSWLIGAEIVKNGSGIEALRYMEQPSLDGISIDRADQYTQGMEVHYSSGVYNRLFYLMAHKSGWNIKKAFHVMVKANMDYWTPSSTFAEGACGVINATQDVGYSVADVKGALDEVGIDYQNCVTVSFRQ